MSILTAYVSDVTREIRFFADCYRTDLVVGDAVVVGVSISKYGWRRYYATIRKLAYDGLTTGNVIICKAGDFKGNVRLPHPGTQIENLYSLSLPKLNGNNVPKPKLSPITFKGVLSHYHFVCSLIDDGWKTLQPRGRVLDENAERLRKDGGSRTFFNQHGVYAITRHNRTAVIYLAGGVHIQVIAGDIDEREISLIATPDPELGLTVQHAFVKLKFNLYEGLLRFSKSFLEGEADLTKYFVSQGEIDQTRQSDYRMKIWKEWCTTNIPPGYLTVEAFPMPGESPLSNSHYNSDRSDGGNHELNDLYDALSEGDERSVYMSDGIWLNADGELDDKGR